MSDFFSDDFTVELKIYFVESIKSRCQVLLADLEVENFDECLENLKEEVQSWVADAQTNELTYLAKWFQGFFEKENTQDSIKSLKSYLQVTQEYTHKLLGNIAEDGKIFAEIQDSYSESFQEQYLVFKMNQEFYAVTLKSIKEVTILKKLSKLIEPQDRILGYMPFRGEAIPVLDMTFLGIPEKVDNCQVGIVCTFKGREFLIYAKETKELVSASESQLRALSTLDSRDGTTFIKNVLLFDNSHALVLDVEKMAAA